jgi:CheY-specific phosphatase CheX
MFDETVVANPDAKKSEETDTIVTAVELKQDVFSANMLFSFDYDLLYILIEKIYPSEVLEDREAFEDTACEITNIVCNRVKAMLNSFGTELEMSFPFVNRDGKIVQLDAEVISLHFSLKDNNLHVDFGFNKQAA